MKAIFQPVKSAGAKCASLMVAALLVSLGFSAKHAEAAIVTLDFNSGTLSNTGVASGGTTYDTYMQSGFTLKTLDSTDHLEGTLNGYSPAGTLSWHKTGSNSSTNNQLITTFSGGAFDLLRLDVLLNSDGLTITSSKGGLFNYVPGSTGSIAFSSLGADWQNITSFTIGITGNQNTLHRLDSIVLNNVPTTAVVPEPSSLALYGVGALGLMVGVARRHRKARSAA